MHQGKLNLFGTGYIFGDLQNAAADPGSLAGIELYTFFVGPERGEQP
jgi:hypothetical protein